MSEICNSPYFFDRLSFSKNEILKKLKISSMAYALIQRVDKISILFFRIVLPLVFLTARFCRFDEIFS